MALQPFQHHKPEQGEQPAQSHKPAQHHQAPQFDPDGEVGTTSARSMTPKPFKEPKEGREYKEPKAFKEYRTPQCPPPTISSAWIEDNGDGTEDWEFTLGLQNGFEIGDYGANFRFILNGVFTGASGSDPVGVERDLALTDTFPGYTMPSGSTFLMTVLVRNTTDSMLDSAARTETSWQGGKVSELIADNANASGLAWPDSSTQSNDPTIVTGFTKNAAALNGHATVSMNPFGQLVEIPVPHQNNMTIIAVVKFYSGNRAMVFDGSHGWYGGTGEWQWATGNSGFVDLGVPTTDWAILSLTQSCPDLTTTSTSNISFINGGSPVSFDAGSAATPSDHMALNGIAFGNAQSTTDWAHHLMFNRILPDDEREQWEDYLGELYGITITR